MHLREEADGIRQKRFRQAQHHGFCDGTKMMRQTRFASLRHVNPALFGFSHEGRRNVTLVARRWPSSVSGMLMQIAFRRWLCTYYTRIYKGVTMHDPLYVQLAARST